MAVAKGSVSPASTRGRLPGGARPPGLAARPDRPPPRRRGRDPWRHHPRRSRRRPALRRPARDGGLGGDDRARAGRLPERQGGVALLERPVSRVIYLYAITESPRPPKRAGLRGASLRAI